MTDPKSFILEVKPEDITKEFFDEHFANKYDVKTKKIIKPPIDLQYEFILKKGEYYNKEDVKTNVGQLLVNKVLYGRTPRIQEAIGYIAKPFDKDVVGDIEKQMAAATLSDKITIDDWATYLNCIQWFGNTMNSTVSSSFTPDSTKILPKIDKMRKEELKKYKKELDEGNVVRAVEISDKLVAAAKEELKNDVGMILYDSKAKPKFGNNYKNMFIIKSPVYLIDRGEFQTPSTAFMDGVQKDPKSITQAGTSVVNGAYSKCCRTAEAGYLVKKFFATYQGITLDEPGSDCKSKGYREVKLTKKNIDQFKLRYMIEGSKLVMLTPENKEKYIGKTVKMRSPMYCVGDKLCNKCAGELYYKIGIRNIGLTTSSVGSNFLQYLMKSFHDSTLSLNEVDLNDFIVE